MPVSSPHEHGAGICAKLPIMLGYLTLLLACQLAGEMLVAATGLPVPGPVCGMALLFVCLLIFGLPDELARLGEALLSNLSLLFVPAGVGVMLHAQLMSREWLPIGAAIVVSTLATVIVTGLMMKYAGPRETSGTDTDSHMNADTAPQQNAAAAPNPGEPR
jgi:holin-like protein